MKQAAKDIKKNMKILKKPQYSDKSYFGHKRPPKKRPLYSFFCIDYLIITPCTMNKMFWSTYR